jgi:hypothetical protein
MQKTPCIRFLSIFHQFDSLCIALSHCIGTWQKSCRLEIKLASKASFSKRHQNLPVLLENSFRLVIIYIFMGKSNDD